MSQEIITVQNIRGYIDKDDIIWLNAEDVARGLGFTEEKNGVRYVEWRRVNEYLQEFGFSPQVAEDDFIPENMFYRLAMKAENEAAEVFQTTLLVWYDFSKAIAEEAGRPIPERHIMSLVNF